MPDVPRQRDAAAASRARRQSRQFPAHVADAGADQGLVTDEPERKADQDRREGSEPWPLCCFPDGRGRLPTTTVPGDSAAHCRTTAAATTSVTRSIVMHSRAIDARTAPKCQEKRSDQTFEHRFGGLESRLPAVLRIWASSHFRIGLPLNARLNKHNDKGVIHVHVCLAGRKRPRGHDYSR